MCRKSSDVGDKSSEKELWKLSFDSSKEYEKVQDFLKSFSADDNLTFATQESFWKDFLQDDFDIEGFVHSTILLFEYESISMMIVAYVEAIQPSRLT